jgi:hypothetical protein
MTRSILFRTCAGLLIVVFLLYASGVAPAAYNLVMDEASALARRSTINFAGAGVTCVDNAGQLRTDCTIPGGGGTPYYQTVQDETTGLTQRATINFAGSGVTCADNGGTSTTDCVIPGGTVGAANYSKAFNGVSSLTITNAEHGFGQANLIVNCYDNSSPPRYFEPSQVTIDPGTFQIVVTFSGSSTGHCVVNGGSGPGAGNQSCALYTVASTNAAFIVAGTAADVALFTLPQFGKITGTTIKHSAQFSDGVGAMTDVSVSVGNGVSTYDQYAAASSIGEVTAVADTTFYDTVSFKSLTMAVAGGAVSAHFIATGRNFGNGGATFLTGGSVGLWICSARVQ